MKRYKYIGTFISDNGNTYKLTTYCNSFTQALILLTAEAINSGKHYQLNNIVSEDGTIRYIKDLNRISILFY